MTYEEDFDFDEFKNMEENSRVKPIAESRQTLTLKMLTETYPSTKYNDIGSIDNVENIQAKKSIFALKNRQVHISQ